MPAASTRASICFGPGRGVGTRRTPKWANPTPSRTTARISAGMDGARSSPALLASFPAAAFFLRHVSPLRSEYTLRHAVVS